MRTNLVYEVFCLSDPGEPLGRIGRILPRPGGLLIATDGMSMFLKVEDPDEEIIDDEANGHLEIDIAQGHFILNAIDADAGNELSPFYPTAPTEFQSNQAAQDFYRQVLGPI